MSWNNLLSIFSHKDRKTPAAMAKERLQIIMAHNRVGASSPDYLPMLQKELLAVISKYVDVGDDKVEVKFDQGGGCSTLEVNIELPAVEQTPRRAGLRH